MLALLQAIKWSEPARLPPEVEARYRRAELMRQDDRIGVLMRYAERLLDEDYGGAGQTLERRSKYPRPTPGTVDETRRLR